MGKTVESTEQKDVKVSVWPSRRKCYMAMICWIFGTHQYTAYSENMLKYGVSGLLPILVLYFVFAVPLCYMEMALGQFSKCSYINIWRLSPPFKGIGLSCLLVFLVWSCGANVKTVIISRYLVDSLKNPIPWFACTGRHAKDNCYILGQESSWQMKCLVKNNSSYCDSLVKEPSATHYWNRVIAVEAPFYRFSSISNDRMLYSAISSLIIYLIVRKGVKSMHYFIPYLVVIPHAIQLLLLTTAMMMRSSNKEMTNVSRSTLGSTEFWRNVISHTIMGPNLGLGGNIMLGSEIGDFRAPIHMAAIGIYSFNFFASVLFGLFCVKALEIYVYEAHVPVDTVSNIRSGMVFRYLTLVFESWPWAPQFWCVLHFGTIYIINIRYKVIVIHGIQSGINEFFPRTRHYSDMVAFSIICIDFLTSLFYYDSNAVNYYHLRLEMMNTLGLIILMYKLAAVVYVYGVSNVIDDIHFMLGFRPSAFWRVAWHMLPISAIILFSFLVWDMMDHISFKVMYEELHYMILFATFSLTCLLITPTYFSYYSFRRRPFKWHKLLKPSPLWGPYDVRLRKSREMFSGHSMTKEYVYRQQRLSRRFETEENV